MSRRVLALGHDAGRQGAPRVMLDMLSWFRENSDFEFEVILHMGGALLEDFSRVATTAVLNPFLGSPRFSARVARTLVPDAQALDRLLARRHARRLRDSRFDVVWMNSLASWKVAEAVAPLGVPRVLHVHELAKIIELVGPSGVSISGMADHFVAASNAVRENLISGHGIDPENITVVYSSILPSPTPAAVCGDRSRERSRLGIGVEDFVLVGCGVGSVAKGIDLIGPLLVKLQQRGDLPPVHLIWVGRLDDGMQSSLDAELQGFGVAGSLHLVGEVDNPRPFFSLADAFVLPSREEAFPLVVLEAAQCGLPVICFADAGGAPEFVENDAGRSAPYLDLDAFAAAVTEMILEPDLRRELGERARQKVEARFTVADQAPLLQRVLLDSGGGP